MKRTKKIPAFVLTLALAGAVPAFSQDLADLQRAAGDFSEALAASLPFNASLGLNWADAYTGMFFPGLPPHFGVGVALGYTTVNFGAVEDLLKQFKLSVPDGFNLGQMILPAYVAEARIGGFFLPFDVGLKFGTFEDLGNSSATVDYFLAGGDFRYALVDGKKNLLLPNVSVGVGLNYLSGSFTGSQSSTLSFPVSSPGKGLELSNLKVALQWETLALDFKAQISKSFLILTPYLGLGASHAWSSAGYSVEAGSLSYNGSDITDTEKAAINAAMKSAGVEGLDFGNRGFSTIIEDTGWSLRAFGGLSVNMAVFRLDLTGLYNFFDGNYGVTLGARFQL
jgi:hypothetical protein